MSQEGDRRFTWTFRRRKFVEEYVRTWNGAEAARRAGYSTNRAGATASRLLAQEEIKAAIQERIAAVAMSADEVLIRLAEQARSVQAQYLQPDGSVDLEALLADGYGHLVKGTKWDRDGNLIVEFYDAQNALQLLGKHLRLFTEQIEYSGPNGGPIETKDVSDPDERGVALLMALYERVRARAVSGGGDGAGAVDAAPGAPDAGLPERGG